MLIPVEAEQVRVLFDTETNKFLAHVTVYTGKGSASKILKE